MEVKLGYKKTDVGVIPADWEVTTIGSLAETSSGTTPLRALYDRYYRDGVIPWVKTLDLDNSYVVDTDERVTNIAIKETSLRLYPVGSVLVAMYGGFKQIGRTGLLQIPATVNQAITAVLPNSQRLDSNYLLRILNFRVEYWKAVASSSRKDPNITGKEIREFPLPLPTKEEQEAIAAALSDADALIESLEQLVAKKRQIKHGAMQQLLTGQKRLPGFANGSGYKRTEVGVIPKDWKESSIGQIASVAAGGTPSRNISSYWNGDIPWVTTTEIDFGTITETDQHISIHGLKNSAAKLLRPGTLLMALYGQGKTRGKVALLAIEATSNQACAAIVLSSEVSKEFVFHYLASRYDAIRGLSNSGSQENLNGVIVKSIQIPLPPTKAEQEAIVHALSDLDAEIGGLEAKLAKARQVKQGMMHELLTGKTRLVSSGSAHA